MKNEFGARRRRERQQNWMLGVAIVVLLGVAGFMGIARALDDSLADVQRELSLTLVLVPLVCVGFSYTDVPCMSLGSSYQV